MAPDETNQHIHALNPEMSLEILEYGVQAIREHCLDQDTSIDSLGDMTLERWSTLLSQLEELDFIEAGVLHAEELFDVHD